MENIRELVLKHLAGTEFYERGGSYEESLQRVKYLKHVIEDNDGYRVFYVNGTPVKRESDLHTMFRLTWYATTFDVNAEVNNGRGPVDYKVSKGKQNASLVEFKLASNPSLRRNLRSRSKSTLGPVRLTVPLRSSCIFPKVSWRRLRGFSVT